MTFEDRFGRGCGFCARFEGRECRSNLFSGPFCSCMRLSTRPSRYSGHELTASLSLSLSSPRSSPRCPTVSSYRAVRLSIFMSICFRRYWNHTAKNRRPSSHSSPALSAYRIAIFRSFRFVSFRLRFLNLKKEKRRVSKDFLSRELYFVTLLFVEMYKYSLFMFMFMLDDRDNLNDIL